MPFAGRGLGLPSPQREPSASRAAAAVSRQDPKKHAAITFLLCAVYVCCAMAAVQFSAHLAQGSTPLAIALVSFVLLLFGLIVIAVRRMPQLRPTSAVGFVLRPTAARELGLGLATGWAAAVLLVLPGLLTLNMRGALHFDGFRVGATLGSTLLLALFVLGRQLVFGGLPFRSLSQATSPLFASVAFSGVAGLLVLTASNGDAGQALIAAMLQLVLSAAAARTRAVWLGTGLQFAWAWCVTILFGMPSFLAPPTLSIVNGSMAGPRWLTGDGLGPEAALWAGLITLVALVAVWRLTRDYAWHYTFDPIEGAAYAMDVPPPAEHTRMEAAAQAAPLVQIGGVPAGPGSLPPNEIR